MRTFSRVVLNVACHSNERVHFLYLLTAAGFFHDLHAVAAGVAAFCVAASLVKEGLFHA